MTIHPLLEVSGLRVRYGGVEAVRDVSLRVMPGEFVAVIGSNGAGKSSTLKAISGVLAPAGGTIVLDGDDITGQQSHAVVRRGLALVPEGRHVFADQTVADNLLLGGYIRGAAEAGRRLDRAFSLFPRLRERRDQQAGSLSGGEQQMLAIARGLQSEPKLLLIDELSLGLAPKILDMLFPVLADLNRTGLSILLVEQLAHQALSAAARGYVMENGRVLASGPSGELAQDPRVMEAYLGRRPPPTAA